MDIKDMRAFYAIVEEGNISHAAQRLDIAQPALSRQMKRLENSLGVQLFERGSRRIRLTDAGRVMYSRVEHILGMVDGTVREITEIGSGVAGSIRLGTITTSGAMLLPELISEFHSRYPHVTYQIWEAEGARILELLDNRVIEIGITRTQVDSKVYESIVLPNEPLVLIMNKEQEIGSQKDKVNLLELKDKPIIIPLRWQSVFIANCRKLGFEPHIICVSDSIVQDLLLTKMGVGMALLPVSSKTLLTDGNLIYKKLVEPEMSTHTVIAWLKNRTLSSSSEHLIRLFREMYLGEKG
ncbi:MAG: LysR family transcriptional regulator [Selenomonas sp.]|jgi:DNA-binding transcriptional LysR family regulator|uniref:LysR family transcriptional regulator n=1 Tax=Selenomonas sp. AE3005 TaxID=1485543 RepID=UPI000483445D|nr:LysR family transcriptional regulator [Selenomonas sp. AE3005]MBQ1461849.1 LysR family transcriptional regulator [Selenomonas sp.]MBQ1614823.1 LysR family transcriptional regulator [Selenomonas sp.]MBQ1808864.1 LysR family transcriptional regulator [Selenomonas sp.]MBQ1919529.1 LysR family transcriptional regulator [Selenomonas sp.]MBQ4211709.1 LysR family transcriptional regulator [Selenomonas sp.]